MSVFGDLLIRIQSECRNVQTRKIPKTDIFHGVASKLDICYLLYVFVENNRVRGIITKLHIYNYDNNWCQKEYRNPFSPFSIEYTISKKVIEN